MFGIKANNETNNEKKKDNEFNIFDVKSMDEFIEKVTLGFNKTLEKEIKDKTQFCILHRSYCR